MRNKLLVQAKRELPSDLDLVFQDSNVLQVSTGPESLPMAFIIVEADFPNTYLVSFAVDFADVYLGAAIVNTLSRISHVELVEPFFIDPVEGKITWGDDAYAASSKNIADQKQFLIEAEPPTDAKH